MFTILIVLAALGLVALVAGGAWALVERGKTVRREGPEVGAELMGEKMSRESRLQGRSPIVGGAWFGGKAWAVEREAEYTPEELVRVWRSGNLRPILPALVGIGGFVSCLLFGALALTTRSGTLRWAGIGLLAVLFWGAWQFALGLREASRKK